jgi:chemotaxis protein methyltransferase CheR
MIDYESLGLDSEKINGLVKDIDLKYGYDFSLYSKPSLHRRIIRIFKIWNFTDFIAFRQRLLDDELFFEYFLQEITVTVTEMFRDPSFFQALRNEVLPNLNKLPFIRIWHAGCSTGEEVYSMAILLKENNLLHKAKIYATDLNSKVLGIAKTGTYPASFFGKYNENYTASGGVASLEDYCKIENGKLTVQEDLKKHITFAAHNLVSDQSFNEFHLIVCRNVLIYFNKPLQDRVLKLFTESLVSQGYLALGSKESIRFSCSQPHYQVVNKEEKIWQKKELF